MKGKELKHTEITKHQTHPPTSQQYEKWTGGVTATALSYSSCADTCVRRLHTCVRRLHMCFRAGVATLSPTSRHKIHSAVTTWDEVKI